MFHVRVNSPRATTLSHHSLQNVEMVRSAALLYTSKPVLQVYSEKPARRCPHQIVVNSRNFAIRLEGAVRQGLPALAVFDTKRIGGAAKLLESKSPPGTVCPGSACSRTPMQKALGEKIMPMSWAQSL